MAEPAPLSTQSTEPTEVTDVIQTSVAPSDKSSMNTEETAGAVPVEGAQTGQNEEDDDNDEPFDLNSYQPVSEEIISKLLAQAEFYFSDSNVLKDKFLLKNIQTNKGGYVSVKLLGSFRRIQATSKDWRDLAYALRRAETLELNAAGNKIRRKNPLPQWDDSVYDRTIVVTNLQLPEVSVNAVKGIFAKYGSVTLVRILQPGKTIPEDLQPFASKHPALSTRVCAVIEFTKEEEAKKALEELGHDDDWRAMQIASLRVGSRPGLGASGGWKSPKVVHVGLKGKENMKGAVSVESSPASSPSMRRKPRSSRSGTSGSMDMSFHGKHKLGSFDGRGSPCRSPATGRRTPKPSSYTGSGDETGHERYDSSTAPKPIPGRMHHRGTPHGSPDTRRRGADESPLSCSPGSLGTSPWIRRKALMEQSDPSSSPGRNLIAVTRQPRGPDGTKGFAGLRAMP